LPRRRIALTDRIVMAKKKKYYLTATLPDGYVKTIGPVADDFTHYWRIVATLENGTTDVFWGHSRSLADARRKKTAAADAARTRGWASYRFDIVALTVTPA
jgi:hypothetical protein